ncbi:4-hydroxyacetophenone monooxygenase [Alcanivorax sp. P2S70]|uniref:flavin-containing monooxygenase n=1 Tax=Alcanivorax TaxID=59753 RepID=UPI0003B4E194|nr:NAD(P)/FAD-dependent oxidoreductase [Alcanivorax sp. P2S70]ERP91824.1 4-hydroxyacetophenone monooxygenase [Alcanivorax sp. P2S70]
MTSQARINVKTRRVKVAIVGGGFGGLCMAIKLREAGIDDFVILEKGDGLGGTWYHNSYPGAACDVQSHMYSFSFEANPDWSHRYSGQQEIHDYIQGVTDKHNIRQFTRFNAEVTGAHFDDQAALWTLNLADGSQLICQHWVLASGPLHVPSFPNFKGMENFKGKIIHSAQWDHDYDMSGKKVVSIGTGASAIQYVPHVAQEAGHLTVVQRTPPWIIPRDERAYSGMSKWLFRRVPALRQLHRLRLYLSNEARVLPIFNPRIARLAEPALKAFIHYQVKDKETARKLVPNYTLGCKRILISNAYYPTFNRDNVALVTEGVKEIREHSVVFSDGSEQQADCLVLGTGFVVDPRIYMKDFEITGLPGRRLQDDWKDAAQAYLGTTVSGYPNMFQLVGPNTGLGHNSIIFMIESQVRYIMDAIGKLDARGDAWLDVKQEVQDRYNDKLQDELKGTVWQNGGCTSWYQQADGRNTALWPHATFQFMARTWNVNMKDYRWQPAVKNSAAVGAARA